MCNVKKRSKGFTILEVMISLFVFGIGLLVYMNFQAKSASMLFDSETTLIANRLAVEAAEAINSISETPNLADPLVNMVKQFTDDPNIGCGFDTWQSDTFSFATNLGIVTGPFTSRGEKVSTGGTPFFYRFIKVNTYNNETNGGGCNYQDPTPAGVLRVITIKVRWPRNINSTAVCSTIEAANCEEIEMIVIKTVA